MSTIETFDRGDLSELRRLLEADSSNVDERDRGGRTALMCASLAGNVAAMRALLEFGASPTATDHQHATPLHFAAVHQQLDAAVVLAQAGAALEARDVHGKTPLWEAVFHSKGDGKCILFLLSKGANPDHQNNYGVSPRSLANTIANYDIAQFFDDA